MASYYELAHMACNIYDLDVKYQKQNIPNWVPLMHTLIAGKEKEKKGLSACIYQNFSTKECILAIKGTAYWPDLVSDLDFLMDNYMKYAFIPELSELMKHMFALKVHFPEYQYATITGHSLGGILAKMAAAITGDAEKVLAFNSPGVKAALKYVPNSIIHHPRKVETIVTYGDDIGNFKKENDLGRYIEVANIATDNKTRILERVALAGGGGLTGSLGGTSSGAIIGAAIGGPIGAIVGGAVGGSLGGGIGSLLGEGFIEMQEHSMLNLIKSMKLSKTKNFEIEF
ncbi:MAG: hypothetical protein V4591_10185 [Bdellovibrionota bacterium]